MLAKILKDSMLNLTETNESLQADEDAAVRPEIRKIFSDVFQFHNVHFNTAQQDVEKWDSLQHVALIASVESTFGISLSMDEMMEMLSVSDIHAILDRHGV